MLGKKKVHKTETFNCNSGHWARDLTGHTGVPGTDNKLEICLGENKIKE